MERWHFRNPKIVRSEDELRAAEPGGVYSWSLPGSGEPETLEGWIADHNGIFEGFVAEAERVTAGGNGELRREYLPKDAAAVREILSGVLGSISIAK